MLEDQPDAPAYFGRMKRQNKDGPALLGDRPPLAEYESGTLAEGLDRGRSSLYRHPVARGLRRGRGSRLHKRHAGGNFASWASWVIDPEKDARPIVVLAQDEEVANHLRDKLSYVGVDDVAGYATTLEGLGKEKGPDRLTR